MHRVLYIEEILLNIFSFCYRLVDDPEVWPTRCRLSYVNVDLTALARTCRAFKEPALGMIWAELEDLTPLVRCLPATSWIKLGGVYSLKKPLEQSEWHVILGHARRVRALPRLRGSLGLTPDWVEALSKPPNFTRPSIFPNLRVVRLHSPDAAIAPFVRHFANPKLTELSLELTESLGAVIRAFGDQCPAVMDLRVWQWTGADAISALVCHWQHLSSVNCDEICLNVDALTHLSRLRTLTSLAFKVHDAILDEIQPGPSSTPTLTFSALHEFRVGLQFLATSRKLFHHFCIPEIQSLSIAVDTCPTASDLVAFFEVLQGARTYNTLNSLSLSAFVDEDGSVPNITFEHLHPLAAFVNINSIHLNFPFPVDLSEHELLSLASSWPNLETFKLGTGCTPSNAITPRGFLQLLERCRSLRVLFFTLDTRGYTEIPKGHPWRGLTMPKDTAIYLLDSAIEEESVEALGVFFHVAPYPNFELSVRWKNIPMFRGTPPGHPSRLYNDRWSEVRQLSRALWEERRDLRRSLGTRSSQRCP